MTNIASLGVYHIIDTFLQNKPQIAGNDEFNANQRTWAINNEQIVVGIPHWMAPRKIAINIANKYGYSLVITQSPDEVRKALPEGSAAISFDDFMRCNDIKGSWNCVILELTNMFNPPVVQDVVSRYKQGSVKVVVWIG